jgi:hypothetical protein
MVDFWWGLGSDVRWALVALSRDAWLPSRGGRVCLVGYCIAASNVPPLTSTWAFLESGLQIGPESTPNREKPGLTFGLKKSGLNPA